MQVKASWTYETLPEFTDEVPGAHHVSATGEEVAVRLYDNVVYVTRDTGDLHLQILVPYTRETVNATAVRKAEGLPGSGAAHPCLVYVQGSAWHEQHCLTETPGLARIAQMGYVVAVVEYRHSGIAHFPAQVHDAQRAAHFMVEHAAEYDVDPMKIVMGGNSSGGHTAVFSVLVPDEDGRMLTDDVPVAGVIDWYGAVGMLREDGYPTTEDHGLPTSPEGRVMGGNMREDHELALRGTATTYIDESTRLPPFLIVHGTKDLLVNTVNSVDLYERLRACGHDAELYLLDGANHGGAEFFAPQMLAVYDAFMQRCLAR